MPFQEMKIKGAWIHTPVRHTDERGYFEEQFKLEHVENELNRAFTVKQVNHSVSNKGVIRGIHYTYGPEGQAKYVSCPKGTIWDVVVDLRKDSSTYGQWDAAVISQSDGRSIFISEGLGHAFMSLEDGSVANYLCSEVYDPKKERAINFFSKHLAINYEEIIKDFKILNFTQSPKDSQSAEFTL
jgi:dTDP-4-dehydrorhamnose 3,5-epimerase